LILRHEFSKLPTRHEKFAHPLKHGGSKALGIPLEELEEKWKETVIPSVGVTWRQYQISMSEDWYKPRFGQDIFGRLLVDRIRRQSAYYYVVSDSGFTYEAQPLIDAFGVDLVSVYHIHRDGCSFDGDSRNWIDSYSLGVKHFPIDNQPGNPEGMLTQWLGIVQINDLY
jgi:hypothetical protein